VSDWQPLNYLQFAEQRTRPARDILAQVPLTSAEVVFDLGCGPGNSTALLVERFPQATVTGVDNSPAMLAEARRACPAARYVEADLAAWQPPAAQLLYSNATFQWVPDHLAVLDRLAAALPQGGVLAVQMPDNLGEPSHRLMSRVAEEMGLAVSARVHLQTPSAFWQALRPRFSRLDIWHTVYNHPLDGIAGIVDWLSSTGLRPYLGALDAAGRAAFLARYADLLREAYPVMAGGTVLLRFPRLFLVGVR
jgi:trans-aconitate 2-methyltransferase